MISGSLISQGISGLLIVLASLYLLNVYFVKKIKTDPYILLIVLLLLAIGFGIHGISHYQMESEIVL
jgi:hypothetical protein